MHCVLFTNLINYSVTVKQIRKCYYKVNIYLGYEVICEVYLLEYSAR
jgi:hypothetical protein